MASTLRTCSRGHRYKGPGGCPVCWTGHARQRQQAGARADRSERRR